MKANIESTISQDLHIFYNDGTVFFQSTHSSFSNMNSVEFTEFVIFFCKEEWISNQKESKESIEYIFMLENLNKDLIRLFEKLCPHQSFFLNGDVFCRLYRIW